MKSAVFSLLRVLCLPVGVACSQRVADGVPAVPCFGLCCRLASWPAAKLRHKQSAALLAKGLKCSHHVWRVLSLDRR